MSPHGNQSPEAPRSLRRTEARERAALLDVATYDVALDLDRGEETFGSRTTITFRSHGGPTFVDVQPVALTSVTLDERPIDVTRLDRGRLPLETSAGEHTLVVDAVMRYRNDGEGLHRAVDPADGRHYTYAMTFLDAAPSVFGCFDQPDLKARWRLTVRTPRDWTVLGNSPATQAEPGHWELAQTLPLPTYLVALVAGPYHVVRDEHDGIPLGLSARASIARILDHDAEELFTVTKQCFDEFHRLFGVRYPFGDYHQAFVPEFNAGAMESAGCVTLRDVYLFQSRAVRFDHVQRASTIAHEMAHMWFGDLVTPVWWDDLWLNESFAEYMGSRVTAEATEFSECWLSESYARRSWGLSADQRPSTHPVAGGSAEDAEAALQDFDGISYAKGASIVKQLNTLLGGEAFFRGLAQHFDDHRFGNATMADLVSAWERAGDVDLSSARDAWLLTAGPDRLELDRSGGSVRRTPLEGHPADRGHALHVATWEGGSWSSQPLVVHADRVPFEAAAAPVVLDSALETWAVSLLDDLTVAALPDLLPGTTDALLRASAWNAVRNGLQHARLDPDVVIDLLERALPAEDSDDGVGQMLAWALHEAVLVAREPQVARGRLRDLAHRIRTSSPAASSRQLTAFQAEVAADGDAERLRAWLAGADLPDALVVDLQVRWRLLLRLAELGEVGREELADALAAEPTAVSQVEHARAVAALPDAEAKAWAWERFTGVVVVSNYELEAAGFGLWRPGQDEVTGPYVERYFADVVDAAEGRGGSLVEMVTRAFYPRVALGADTVTRAENLLSQQDLPSVIRRGVVDATWDLERRLAIRRTYGDRP